MCIDQSLRDIFVKKYPEADKIIKPVNKTAYVLLSDEENICDAIVMHKDAFDQAISRNDNLCDRKVLLLDNILFTLNNVVYVSPVSASFSKDFIDNINKFIDAGFYAEYHEEFRNEWSENITSSSKCMLSISDASGVDALGKEEIVSPLVLSLFVTSLGLGMFLFRKTARLAGARRLGFVLQDKDADNILMEKVRKMSVYDMMEG